MSSMSTDHYTIEPIIIDGEARWGLFMSTPTAGWVGVTSGSFKQVKKEVAAIERMEKMADEMAERYPSQSIEDMWPVQERVRVMARFDTDTLFFGFVAGYSEGMYDSGGPESGPGPVVETDFVLVQPDDGGAMKEILPEQIDTCDDPFYIVQSAQFPNCWTVTYGHVGSKRTGEIIHIFRDTLDPRGLDALNDARKWCVEHHIRLEGLLPVKGGDAEFVLGQLARELLVAEESS